MRPVSGEKEQNQNPTQEQGPFTNSSRNKLLGIQLDEIEVDSVLP